METKEDSVNYYKLALDFGSVMLMHMVMYYVTQAVLVPFILSGKISGLSLSTSPLYALWTFGAPAAITFIISRFLFRIETKRINIVILLVSLGMMMSLI